MAVGSPMLVAFSLMITILNRYWLKGMYKAPMEMPAPALFPTALKGALSLTEAAQQVPILMTRGGGQLAALILHPDNKQWWSRLDNHVQAAQRGLTLSLVAQSLVALIAWILTIIGTFGTALGSHAEGLVLSSSTLWTWLVSCPPALTGHSRSSALIPVHLVTRHSRMGYGRNFEQLGRHQKGVGG